MQDLWFKAEIIYFQSVVNTSSNHFLVSIHLEMRFCPAGDKNTEFFSRKPVIPSLSEMLSPLPASLIFPLTQLRPADCVCLSWKKGMKAQHRNKMSSRIILCVFVSHSRPNISVTVA